MSRLIQLNCKKNVVSWPQSVKSDSLIKRIGSIVSHLNHYKSTTGLVPIPVQPVPHIHGKVLKIFKCILYLIIFVGTSNLVRVATYRGALKEQMKNAKEILEKAHNPTTGKMHVKNIVASVIEREAGVSSKADCNKRKIPNAANEEAAEEEEEEEAEEDEEEKEEEEDEEDSRKSRRKKKGVSGQIGKERYFIRHNL